MASTYLITGGAGFIGRQLSTELLSYGHSVRVIDSLIPQVHGDTDPPLAGVEFYEGDIRDANLVDRALAGTDGVFHLAAEVGVGQSMYEIARYVGGNDLGTAVLLERLANNPVARLVVASSMSVYGEGLYLDADGQRHSVVRHPANTAPPHWDPAAPDGTRLTPAPTDEAKQIDIASIYALTKYVQERSCLIFGAAYNVEVVALRLFNVFGPGQALSNPYTGVLANFGSRLLHSQRPLVFEDGRQMRDFVHVRDVARAFRLAMEALSQSAMSSTSVADMLTRLLRLLSTWPMRWACRRLRHFCSTKPAREISAIASPISARHATCSVSSRCTSWRESLDELVHWIRGSGARDRGEDAKRQLEARGLVT